jgi:peptidoglycan DL-endopeptidase CwlO
VRAWSRRLITATAGFLALGLVFAGGSVQAATVAGQRTRVPAVGGGAGQAILLAGGSLSSDKVLPPLRKLLQADLLIVGPRPLPAGLKHRIQRLSGVTAAVVVDAGRIRIRGRFADLLGVNASQFRAFAAGPTARSAPLWAAVARGGMAVSFTMGKGDRLPLGKAVPVTGAVTRSLQVAGFGTVGIAGVDAVVNHSVARSLGVPQANAIVVSAPHASLAALIPKVRRLLPARAAVAPLVTQVTVAGTTVSSGSAGGVGITTGRGLTAAQLAGFLAAARSRVGLPYVWGGSGPTTFDCSGLVQWSMARAGVLMPRVAADQARTGPLVPARQVQPGDLLFYHTDPTAPSYISHVAIYLGGGMMIQAPRPGLTVEVVPADFGAGFAGAVRVYPAVAAAVAGNPAG